MSYDIWIAADLGGPESVSVGALDWNYTSNVAPMWREAMPGTDGLAGLDGMACSAAAEALAEGIARMEREPEKYRAMNPSNGWGDFDSQLERLRALHAACRAAPRAVVGVGR